MQRWQHLAPSTRLASDEGTIAIARQMYGLARPAEQWEREYFPARVDDYDPTALSRLIAAGELVWIGGSAGAPDEPSNLSLMRFVRRGSARLWLGDGDAPVLSDVARRTLDALERDGASFFEELVSSTGLTTRSLRDALRELTGAGLVTNDTVESMRQVIRWRPLVSPRDRAQPDPTRWLPADFTPSANRHVVQRRPNLRRLPRWKRPDKSPPESIELARALVARANAARARRRRRRVGVRRVDRATMARPIRHRVARDVAPREAGDRVAADLHELKRLEFRGEVRRGYFVQGLSGAQFARPKRSRCCDRDRRPGRRRADRHDGKRSRERVDVADRAGGRATVRAPAQPRSLLVTIDGVVVLIAERRGARVSDPSGHARTSK